MQKWSCWKASSHINLLLVLDLWLNLGQQAKTNTTQNEQIKWWEIPENKDKLVTALKAVNVDHDQPVEALWSGIINLIYTATIVRLVQALSFQYFINSQAWWWNKKFKQPSKRRRWPIRSGIKHASNHIGSGYKMLKLMAKQTVVAAKAKHYEALYKQWDESGSANNIYLMANSCHCLSQDISQIKNIKDEHQKVFHYPMTILKKWSKYLKRWISHLWVSPANIHNGSRISYTTDEEWKTMGSNYMPAEAWKILGWWGAELLTSLFSQLVWDGVVPQVRSTSTTVLIWKNHGNVG